mmetsp:Transcript_8393/g.24067  ORF Transcript_8393/g.24067 Transcript_8393/m.24067 type:complete len:313 (+) Transcript_8393:379-1317(+)|eukprot:CAMPEP_0117657582 /NCGR_PEP_ID=MMETSP0804-20121206/5408_1 /TAXON_ID=1074897 /ORGANISM="Tetraselmis astigmatica, Strain CCMP880" /LENGTH=312 /DNA_ID=CAMNT_0005464047 /DNA_START=405 /DNA_END=1343 /DNA_ORIENTATION=-
MSNQFLSLGKPVSLSLEDGDTRQPQGAEGSAQQGAISRGCQDAFVPPCLADVRHPDVESLQWWKALIQNGRCIARRKAELDCLTSGSHAASPRDQHLQKTIELCCAHRHECYQACQSAYDDGGTACAASATKALSGCLGMNMESGRIAADTLLAELVIFCYQQVSSGGGGGAATARAILTACLAEILHGTSVQGIVAAGHSLFDMISTQAAPASPRSVCSNNVHKGGGGGRRSSGDPCQAESPGRACSSIDPTPADLEASEMEMYLAALQHSKPLARVFVQRLTQVEPGAAACPPAPVTFPPCAYISPKCAQ